jgi:general secretion pathway protein A
MYTSFFGLNEKPFSITPDPRYLFLSERHGEALAHLVYGVTESGGFMQLTGEVGTGKTTLVRTLLQNRLPDNADVAVILNPQLSALEFLETICEELGIAGPDDRGSSKALIDSLNKYLLAAHAEGRRTIIVVDEAQNLAADVLEQVRLLTNLETAKQKLLQIILIGQPELRELLARNDLRQLAQRITGRYHLEPLTRDETSAYIVHRLKIAGALGELFDSSARREVFRLSHGVPRLINVICDRALLGAYTREMRTIDRRIVHRAAAEISGSAETVPWLRWTMPAIGILGGAVILAGAWSLLGERRTQGDAFAEPPAEVAAAELGNPGAGVAHAADVVEPSLDEQLRLAQDLTGAATAIATLFDLWSLEYPGNPQNICAQVESTGYACVSQRGSISRLRQLDRPAVLTLTDSRGVSHRVVLTALQGDRAELSIAGVAVSHPVAAVADAWFGQYLLLWKPPNGRSMALGLGVQDGNVVWLRQSLAAIDDRYRAEPTDLDVFDARLEQRVRAFQRDHRLDVDGLAGRQTQIIINSLLALDGTPRLTTSRLAQD